MKLKYNGITYVVVLYANRSALTNALNEIDISFPNDNKFIDLSLYGNDKFDDKKNSNILLKSTIKFIRDCQGFDEHELQLLNKISCWI